MLTLQNEVSTEADSFEVCTVQQFSIFLEKKKSSNSKEQMQRNETAQFIVDTFSMSDCCTCRGHCKHERQATAQVLGFFFVVVLYCFKEEAAVESRN